MYTFKRDILTEIEFDIRSHLPDGELIVDRFEVVPIDHNVVDRSTPRLFLSEGHLVLSYDEIMEVYALDDLEIGLIGEYPRFTLLEQLIEKSRIYQNGIDSGLSELRDSEFALKLSIIEEKQVPKDFVVRDGPFVQKSMKTWAMGRIVMNQKAGMQYDPKLRQMIDGNFNSFNQRTVLYFAGISTVYLLMKITVIPALPEIISTILDVFFGLVLIFMGIWLYLSSSKNLERYQAIFRSYTPVDTPVDPQQ